MNNSTIKPNPGTDLKSGLPMAQAVTWSSMFILEAVVIILGNAITISIFSTRKRNKQHSYLLMINLAVADVLIGALPVPLYIYLAGSFPLQLWVGIDSTSLSIIFSGLDILLGFASLLTLTAISLERFYASTFPLHYKGIRFSTYLITIASIWGSALVMSTSCVAFLYLLGKNGMKFATYISMTLISVLCLVICVSYVHIWAGIRRRRRDLRHRNSDLDNRLALTLVIVTFSSLAAWLPFVIVNFCYAVSPFELKEEFVLFSKLLHYGNSVLNPVIYSFRVPGFRKSAKRILSFTRPQRPSGREAAHLDNATVDASHSAPTFTLKESRNAEEKLFSGKVLEEK